MNFLQNLAPEYALSIKIFLHTIALNFLIAFASLLPQLKGLFGQEGIFPISEIVNRLKNKGRFQLCLENPSLFWFDSTDKALIFSCAAGFFFSLLAFFGIFQTFSLFICWVLYLSFMSLGYPFLSFQWDCLLLETGFLSFLISLQPVPSLFSLTALWMVLFKLMFLSGAVKLLSHDAAWWNQTALYYHYETQPLPNPLSHFFHNLPKGFQRISCALMFAIELLVPFLLFIPGKGHEVAFVAFGALQILIFLSGNFAFFNILTLTLCIPLLNQEWLPFSYVLNPEATLSWGRALDAVFLFITLCNALVILEKLTGNHLIPPIFIWMKRFYILNSYGLFATMTKKRYEIIIEGSLDGEIWEEFEGKWKIGELQSLPKQVAPHQPRLDWQMWFAALTNRPPGWFQNLLIRLLQNKENVRKLFKKCPFKNTPPNYVRANLYEYQFTTFKELKETGNYWKRTYLGTYFPPISLS